MTETLISPEARAMVGQVLERLTATVDKKEFQRFAVAVGDHNPLYFDEEYAASLGHRDVVMPPMFTAYAMTGFVSLDRLREDGTVAVSGGDIPLPPRKMAGGHESYFLAPAYPGDVLTAVTTVFSLEEKRGKSGSFVLLRRLTDYRNQDDVAVAQIYRTTIAR
jgi:acyl dehydratase